MTSYTMDLQKALLMMKQMQAKKEEQRNKVFQSLAKTYLIKTRIKKQKMSQRTRLKKLVENIFLNKLKLPNNGKLQKINKQKSCLMLKRNYKGLKKQKRI